MRLHDMIRPRICMVTPGHLSTNPRLVKEADVLVTAGYDVSVVCANFLDWGATHDRAYSSRPWSVARKVSFGPLAPMPLRVKQVLRQRAARAIRRLSIDSAELQEASVHQATAGLIAAASSVKADLYIARYTAALPAAARAARHNGAIYAYDAEDFHLGDLPDRPEHAEEKALIREIEARYLPGAAYVSAAAPGIAKAYALEYGIEDPTVILNVFPQPKTVTRATRRGTVEPRPSLYWFSQTIGPDRGIETALDAISLSKTNPHLYLRGRPAAGFDGKLRQTSAALGVADRLHLLDIAAPNEMEALAANYDLGLVSETMVTKSRALCLTNKIFSFLAAGVPPLISDTPAQVAFAKDTGLDELVFPIGDADALAQLLDTTLSNPARLADLRARCFELARTRFNWNIESRTFLNLISQSLGNPATAISSQ